MATDKPRVAGYVSQELKALFQTFTKERKLSESKALGVLLSEYFGVSQEVAHHSSLGLVKRIEALEEGLSQLSQRFDEYSPPPDEWFTSVPGLDGETVEEIEEQQPVKVDEPKSEQINLLESESENDSPSELPAKADGKRWLTKNQAYEMAVSLQWDKSPDRFMRWSKSHPEECLSMFGIRRLPAVRGSRTAPVFEDVSWRDRIVDGGDEIDF